MNENSHIKIKPMRLSKGFDSGDMNHQTSEAAFEATETSSFSALSRGTSIGAQESAVQQQQLSAADLGYQNQRNFIEESKQVLLNRKTQ